MSDNKRFTNVCVGDYVRLKVPDEVDEVEGTVIRIIENPKSVETIVEIDNYTIGNVQEIINSKEIILKRILDETQNSENKSDFYGDIMRTEVIPKTIQSFLNSSGGYLYIGIFDGGSTPDEKIIGLEEDFDAIKNNPENRGKIWSVGKLKDKLRSDIEASLDKYLKSESPVGPLLKWSWFEFDEKIILEIKIDRSPNPFFYKHWSKKNKEIEFDISVNNEKKFARTLDDFYFRDGSRKLQCTTFESFFHYYRAHFQNS